MTNLTNILNLIKLGKIVLYLGKEGNIYFLQGVYSPIQMVEGIF